jgi:2-polyprenyl-3-methyl-5-hydroxy-6-metoxy-1,4-benzoquinol methylase
VSGDHYSYSHYASRPVAEGFDTLRFSGPIGRFLLESQEALLIHALAPTAGRHILDVGTGTGRAAIGLAKAGAVVTGIDASAEMLDVARVRAQEAGVEIAFAPGDAHALPFEDRSFDASISLRVLMHAPDWRQCVAELCRVSRWRVVADFPARCSFAALESVARRVRQSLGGTTEAYRVISESDVERVFAQHGFTVKSVHRQFVLPIALHKSVNSLPATQAAEGVLNRLGLRRLLGSPVTMVAER